MLTKWESLIWERFKLVVAGERGSFNILGYEHLSAQIELMEELGLA